MYSYSMCTAPAVAKWVKFIAAVLQLTTPFLQRRNPFSPFKTHMTAALARMNTKLIADIRRQPRPTIALTAPGNGRHIQHQVLIMLMLYIMHEQKVVVQNPTPCDPHRHNELPPQCLQDINCPLWPSVQCLYMQGQGHHAASAAAGPCATRRQPGNILLFAHAVAHPLCTRMCTCRPLCSPLQQHTQKACYQL